MRRYGFGAGGVGGGWVPPSGWLRSRGGEGVELEAGAGGFVARLGRGVFERGGVLHGEAEVVEGVRGAGERGGEFRAAGERFVLVQSHAAELAEGGFERGGVA